MSNDDDGWATVQGTIKLSFADKNPQMYKKAQSLTLEHSSEVIQLPAGMQNLGPQQRIPRPENQNVDDWCYRQSKNKPQSNTISAPMILMMVSGLYITWGFSPITRKQFWYERSSENEHIIVIISWFIGSSIGAVVLLFIHERFTKKTLYIAGALIYACSTLLIAIFSQEYLVLLFGRLIGGIAHGLVYITAIMHAADNSINSMRPQIVAMMQMGILAGAMVGSASLNVGYTSDRDENIYYENRFIKLVGLAFSLIAILVCVIFNYESVVVSASRGEDQLALNNMCRLRREPIDNMQLQYDYQEIKAMLDEDKGQNMSPLQEGNGRAMIAIVLTRVLIVLGMNYGLQMIKVEMLTPLVTEYVSPFLGVFVQVFFVSILCLMADWIGRKRLLILSAALSAVCLLGLTITSATIDGDSTIKGVLSFGFDAAKGVGVVYIPDILMAEVFPVKKRFASAMIAVVVENVLQIILTGILSPMDMGDFELPILGVSTGLFVVITAALFYLVPTIEANSTVRSVRAKFRNSGLKRGALY